MADTEMIMWGGTVRSLPLGEQLRVAAAAGCTQLSIAPADYVRWLGSGVSTADMLSMASDAGVRLSHLDPLVRWVPDWRSELPEFPAHIFDYHEDDFFRMADALGVTSFTIWGAFAVGKHGFDYLVDHYGSLCERALRLGLRCDIEFTPICGIPDLRSASAIIEASGAPNSGIIFDFWHFMRGDPDLDVLRTVPGERITMVQVNDAAASVPPGVALVEDSLFRRCPPGEGAFPVDDLIRALRDIGGLRLAGPEIFSSELDRMGADEIAAIGAQTVARLRG